MRRLLALAVLAALGCGANERHTSISPYVPGTPRPTAQQPLGAPAPTFVYSLAAVEGDNQAGRSGQKLTIPLMVEVRDSNGTLVDGIYVRFEPETPGTRYGLGGDTTGHGYYLGTEPGTGRAAVSVTPTLGKHRVKAFVAPTVTSSGQSAPASSNEVFFTIEGTP